MYKFLSCMYKLGKLDNESLLSYVYAKCITTEQYDEIVNGGDA